MRIAICDKDKNVTDKVHENLLQVGEKMGVSAELDVTVYLSGKKFLFDLLQGSLFNLVFLDVKLCGANGVMIGNTVRATEDGDDPVIAYMATKKTKFKGLYSIGTCGVIDKPIEPTNLDKVVKKALALAITREKSRRVFLYNVNENANSVLLSDIAYFKNYKGTTELYTWDESKKEFLCLDIFSGNISDIMSDLSGKQFIQCEPSFIVNLDYIKQMSKLSLTLKDIGATSIPIGKSFWDSTKKAYFERKEQWDG